MRQTIAFEVGNDGPNNSIRTIVTFEGLDELENIEVSLVESGGTWDAEFFTWTLGDFLTNQTAEINITATNNTGSDIPVTAIISGGLRDPNQDNNTVEWTFRG